MTKPSAPSVALRYAAARVAASPFSELSPEGAEAFGAFCRSLTYWLGMAQYANLDEMYRVWKGNKELQGWLSRHVNKSSYTLYYGRRLTQSDAVSIGDTLSRKGRGKVLQWSTRLHTAAYFAALDVVNPPDPPDFQGAVGEAKVNGKKVIVDVDRFIAFCTRHKQDAAPLMVNSQAIELLTSGEDFEGEVLTTPVNATVIRAEFYQKGKTASALTLYHRTSPEIAAEIYKSGKFDSKIKTSMGTEVYFSTKYGGHASDYGSAVVAVRIPERYANLDDEFPDGEQHYWVAARHLRRHGVLFRPKGKTASRIDAPPAMLKEITEWVQRVLAGEALADVEEAREKAENQLREIEGGTSSMTRGPFAVDPETARSLLLEKLAEMDRVERKARRFRPLSS